MENLTACAGMTVREIGLRALAYGLTELDASQQQIEPKRSKNYVLLN